EKGAAAPGELVIAGLTFEREEMMGNGGEVGIGSLEVLVEGDADNRIWFGVEVFEGRAVGGGEAEIGIDGPHDRGHLLEQGVEARLVALAGGEVAAHAPARQTVAYDGSDRRHARPHRHENQTQ